MSHLLRQLWAALVILVLIGGTQAADPDWSEDDAEVDKRFLRIGRSTEELPAPAGEAAIDGDDAVAEPAVTIDKRDVASKRIQSHIRVGRDNGQTWIRIGRRSTPYRSSIRVGRRDGTGTTWIRIGKRSPYSDSGFLRIGKSSEYGSGNDDMGFLRIGKAYDNQNGGFLRIGKAGKDANDDEEDEVSRPYIRLGRSILHSPKSLKNSGASLTPEQIQFLVENKERLLRLLELNPGLANELPEDDSYFAFPRQGRAMSFYFPRMGRSGADAEKAAEAGYCCAEGVRRVVTAGERIYETCKPEHSCCRGLNEIKKNYKDISITECAVDDSLDQIRAYIGND